MNIPWSDIIQPLNAGVGKSFETIFVIIWARNSQGFFLEKECPEHVHAGRGYGGPFEWIQTRFCYEIFSENHAGSHKNHSVIFTVTHCLLCKIKRAVAHGGVPTHKILSFIFCHLITTVVLRLGERANIIQIIS